MVYLLMYFSSSEMLEKEAAPAEQLCFFPYSVNLMIPIYSKLTSSGETFIL